MSGSDLLANFRFYAFLDNKPVRSSNNICTSLTRSQRPLHNEPSSLFNQDFGHQIQLVNNIDITRSLARSQISNPMIQDLAAGYPGIVLSSEMDQYSPSSLGHFISAFLDSRSQSTEFDIVS